MLIEITNYYALPGRTEDVLAQRRRATAIRLALGLPPGQTFRKLESDGPDVRWECVFATRTDFEHDKAVRASSELFAKARRDMHMLVERFERHVQESVESLE
jgi:hypothetical protein